MEREKEKESHGEMDKEKESHGEMDKDIGNDMMSERECDREK